MVCYIFWNIFKELEEAEVELDIVHKENALDGNQIPTQACKYFFEHIKFL